MGFGLIDDKIDETLLIERERYVLTKNQHISMQYVEKREFFF